jgi:hypothetical protein
MTEYILSQLTAKQKDGQANCSRSTAYNSTLAIGGVPSPLDSFVVAESSVLRTNFCAKKPAHRQSAKRQDVKKLINLFL